MSTKSHDFRHQFLAFAAQRQALRFGEFTLKSGRISPYFFNAGSFSSGKALATLGRFYASAIVASGVSFDMLFGPAYKGIPLVASVAIALAEHHALDCPWCFNRKESKDHGEGGLLVGAPLTGRVLIIDDVITKGTAIGESMALLDQHGASLAGIVIALDRQERGDGAQSAVQQVEQRYSAAVISVATLDDLIGFVGADASFQESVASMQAYRDQYGLRSAG